MSPNMRILETRSEEKSRRVNGATRNDNSFCRNKEAMFVVIGLAPNTNGLAVSMNNAVDPGSVDKLATMIRGLFDPRKHRPLLLGIRAPKSAKSTIFCTRKLT